MPIHYRTLDYSNADELRRYLTLFYAIPAGVDEYYFEKSPELIASFMRTACNEETAANTFAGIAIAGADIVGLHILRRFEEGPLVGVHIAGLWVSAEYRRMGVARSLKERGEAWARSIGAAFVNTNVRADNSRMLEINEGLGFEPYKIKLRKRL